MAEIALPPVRDDVGWDDRADRLESLVYRALCRCTPIGADPENPIGWQWNNCPIHARGSWPRTVDRG